MRPTYRNTMIFAAVLMTFGTVMQTLTASSQIGFNSNVLAVILSSAAIGALVPMLNIFKVKAQLKSDKLFYWVPAFWAGCLPAGLLTIGLTGDVEAGWLIFLTLCSWAPALSYSFLAINYLPQPNRGI